MAISRHIGWSGCRAVKVRNALSWSAVQTETTGRSPVAFQVAILLGVQTTGWGLTWV